MKGCVVVGGSGAPQATQETEFTGPSHTPQLVIVIVFVFERDGSGSSGGGGGVVVVVAKVLSSLLSFS